MGFINNDGSFYVILSYFGLCIFVSIVLCILMKFLYPLFCINSRRIHNNINEHITNTSTSNVINNNIIIDTDAMIIANEIIEVTNIVPSIVYKNIEPESIPIADQV
uniref:Uncharacterized protein n=1 Tax=viral metagenome TaxID=1070528 RepID=A0A6C0DAD3_9ZZZZ